MGVRLMAFGSSMFLFGAAIGVPSIFMTAERARRLRLLEAHATRWRIAQVPYAFGPVIAGLGTATRGFELGRGAGQWGTIAAGMTLVVGSLTWSYSCWRRGVDPVGFVSGRHPGWPFSSYVMLTLVGLGGLGLALFAAGAPTWLAWTVIVSDTGFLALYGATRDIPPFVFYVLLLVVALAW